MVPTAVVLVAAFAFGLYWFQPWKLWVDTRVDEALPALATASVTPPPTEAPSRPATPPRRSVAPNSPGAPVADNPAPRLLARGTLLSHEHATSGTVSVIAQPDGSRVLAIADLDTSNGPDLRVWLTDAPVLEGRDGWHVFDDGTYVSLGRLKGNLGNQVYDIPPDVDLGELTSLSIWCDRFDVSFGAAELRPVST